jgi:hypothetical protein
VPLGSDAGGSGVQPYLSDLKHSQESPLVARLRSWVQLLRGAQQSLHDLCSRARSHEIGSGLQKISDMLDGLDSAGSFYPNVRGSALAKPSNLLWNRTAHGTAAGVLEIGDSGFNAQLDCALALSVVEERKFEHNLDADPLRSFDDAVDVGEVFALHSGEQETDIRHEVDFFDPVLDQLSRCKRFSGSGHRTQGEINKRGRANSSAPKRDAGLVDPAGGNHRGVEVVLKAIVDMSLPLGAGYGIRDEGGLDVAGEVGVGGRAGAGRDVGVGHGVVESHVLGLRHGILKPLRQRVAMLANELDNFLEFRKRRNHSFSGYGEAAGDDGEPNRGGEICARG